MARDKILIPAGENRKYIPTDVVTDESGAEVHTPIVIAEGMVPTTSYQVNPTSVTPGFITVSGSTPKTETFATVRAQTDIFVLDHDIYVEIDSGDGTFQGKFVLPASVGFIIYATHDKIKRIRLSNVTVDGSHNARYQVKGSI